MKHLVTFRTFLVCALLMLSHGLVQGQSRARYSQHLATNQVKAMVLNGTDQWWNLFFYGSGYEVPVGSGLHSGFSAALWIGGLDETGALHVSASTYRQNGVDFFTGPARTGVPHDNEVVATTPKNMLKGRFATLASGEVVIPHTDGFTIFDEATGLVNEIVMTNMVPESQCLQLSDGRVIIIADMPILAPDVVVVMDTLTFTPAVACTLAGNYARASLTQLSTGEVLLSSYGSELLDPSTLTTTLVMGAPSTVGAKTILLPSDSVLFVGGPLGINSRWFVRSTGSFSTGPALTQTFPEVAMAQMADGNYLITGNPANNNTNVLDVSTRTFSVGPPINEIMNIPVGISLPSGDCVFADEGRINRLSNATGSFVSNHMVDQYGGMGLLPSGNVLLQVSLTECAIYDPVSDKMVDNPYQHIWNLTSDQVNEFIADHAAGTVDYTKYPDIPIWPAHGDVAKGEDRLLAPFADLDGDGVYNPSAGEYPCVTGDQTLWYVAHDQGTHAETGSPSGMNLQVAFTAYAFKNGSTSCIDSFVDYTTFYHYEITNRSGQDYHDVFLGLWNDCDLGNWNDDYIGADSVRDLGFIYNGDDNDETVYGYGLNPPAIGIKFLNTPSNLGLTNFMSYKNDFSILGNPAEYSDYYGYLRSEFKDSTHLVDNGLDGYTGTAPGSFTNYFFDGDAGWCGGAPSGWTQASVGSVPMDARSISSCGPLYLPADSTISLDFAVIWARTVSGGANASVCELQQATDAITNWWSGQDFECFNLLVRNQAAEARMPALSLFPNPNSGSFTLRWAKSLGDDQTVSIRDAAGREVAQRQVSRGTRELEITEPLASGIYLVLCSDGTAVKMVVQ
jgi:hypothetical protein